MTEIIFAYNFVDEFLQFQHFVEGKNLNIKYLDDNDAKEMKEIMLLEKEYKVRYKPLIIVKHDDEVVKIFKQGPYSVEKEGPLFTAIGNFKKYINEQERISNNS